MKLLLDTHVMLWAATDPDRLGADAREALEDGASDVFVSIVSGWEIAIKQSLGKLDLPRPAEQRLPEVLRRTGFEVAALGLAAEQHDVLALVDRRRELLRIGERGPGSAAATAVAAPSSIPQRLPSAMECMT